MCIFWSTIKWDFSQNHGSMQQEFIYNMYCLRVSVYGCCFRAFVYVSQHIKLVVGKCQKKKTDVKCRSTRLLIHINIFVWNVPCDINKCRRWNNPLPCKALIRLLHIPWVREKNRGGVGIGVGAHVYVYIR